MAPAKWKLHKTKGNLCVINAEDTLAQMRKHIEADPSGNQLGDYIISMKLEGFLKSEAKELLTIIYLEYQDKTPIHDEIVDGIAAVLDRVTGWCSGNLIFRGE